MAGYPGLRDGFLQTGPAGGQRHRDERNRIFQTLLDTPEGIWAGKADDQNPMDGIKTPSGKIETFIPELEADVLDLTPEKEARDLEMPTGFPLVLNAGRHMKTNINTMMRNPAWNEGKRACTVALSPADAADLNLTDGQDVKVTTAAGSAVGELEISEQVRPGMVLVPHGFGLNYEGTVYGVNVNRLTQSSHRDPIGTPLHRFVPCRVEGVAD
jgi:anaerobic selenocysteine-containing dehydrogenase